MTAHATAVRDAVPPARGDLPFQRLLAPVLDRAGSPIDAPVRADMEARFGRDFTAVRLHRDALADTSAQAINARAYTAGTHIVFAGAHADVGSVRGRHLLAHELAHVVQQAGGETQPAHTSRLEAAAERAADAALRAPAPASRPAAHRALASHRPTAHAVQRAANDSNPQLEELACRWLGIGCTYRGGGGRSGGGGSSGSWEEPAVKAQTPAPAPGVTPPSPAPPPLPFFHGTRWSIARQIPGKVKAVGGGDFAAGFYLHHDANASKAHDRALQWARRMAGNGKVEKYSGVLQFDVPGADYAALVKRNSKVFGLTGTDQKDYAARQKEWLDFITTHGRKSEPTFRDKSRDWVHERREPQPNLPYDIVKGPFYSPLRGTADRKPAASEFAPFAEGKTLPQQVVFANKGIDLLNDASKVKVELQQYDAKTGKRNDPPLASSDPAPSDADIGKQTEEAQLGLSTTA